MRTLALCVLVAGCGSDSDAPSASVKAATPDQLTTSDDTLNDLSITVRYDDADGDLGGGTARVHDCRGDGLVTELPLPAIAPPSVVDDGKHITGELVLHVNDIGALAPGALPAVCDELGVRALEADRAVFCVVLVDAAGHEGAGDCTAPVMLAP